MRNWCIALALMTAGTTIVGCGLFPKDSGSGGSAAITPDRMQSTGGNNAVSTSRQAVLAGQVIDNFNQRRGNVQLTLQPTDGGQATTAITNDQGYFTVSSLQSGKRYKITAKAQNGTVLSSGFAEATAPNVVVLIKLNDSKTELDGKSAGMSGAVGGKHSSIAGNDDYSPTWSRGNPASTGRGDRLGAAPDVNQQPQPQANVTPGINPKLGRPVTSEPPGSNNVPVRPEYIADANSNIGARISPPVMNIPGPNGNAPGDKAQPRTKSEYGGINFFEFTLSDLDGRPTRLADIRGRLTLIDIWNTDSITCQQALPELMKLYKQFRHQGLVVVGIAANEQGTATAKADKIRWRGNKQGVEFPLLMEANDSVKQAFKAEQFTTMILLDESGREVWRHTGFNPDVKAQLEREIVSRLR